MSIRAHVRAQRLDETVRFERKSLTRSASGNEVETWTTVITCRAAVDGAKAAPAEPVVDGGIRTRRDYTVWIRADIYTRFELTPLDRIVWKGRILSIIDIPDQGLRGRLIGVIANAGINQG